MVGQTKCNDPEQMTVMISSSEIKAEEIFNLITQFWSGNRPSDPRAKLLYHQTGHELKNYFLFLLNGIVSIWPTTSHQINPGSIPCVDIFVLRYQYFQNQIHGRGSETRIYIVADIGSRNYKALEMSECIQSDDDGDRVNN